MSGDEPKAGGVLALVLLVVLVLIGVRVTLRRDGL